MTLSQARSELRRPLLRQRRQLSHTEQQHAARGLATQCAQQMAWRGWRSVASYVPVRGEISPHGILALLRPKHIVLPVITDAKGGKMRFCTAQTEILNDPKRLQSPTVRRNRFGIPEPIIDETAVNPRSLDAVLVPLVACDDQGNRLGMGGGFYDRAFAFKRQPHPPSRPKLIGLAHSFQLLESLPSEYWDVPLDVIITPELMLWPKRQ